MPKATFQVAIVFTPGRLISAGVTRGDVDRGLAFLLKLQPAVRQFIENTKEPQNSDRTMDRFVSDAER